MTTFLDTNVLIYLLDNTSDFHQWSVDQLNYCKTRGPAIISDIVYCEFAVGMKAHPEVDAAVSRFALERMRCDDATLWRAASAFRAYRANRGPRTMVLPDFFVGALAEQSDAPLISNNPRDLTLYFPKLKLIKP